MISLENRRVTLNAHSLGVPEEEVFTISTTLVESLEAVDHLVIWVRSGQINPKEHILDGINHAPGSLQLLYSGQNTGKILIRVY